MWKKASMSKFTCISNYDPRGSGNDVNENFTSKLEELLELRVCLNHIGH